MRTGMYKLDWTEFWEFGETERISIRKKEALSVLSLPLGIDTSLREQVSGLGFN